MPPLFLFCWYLSFHEKAKEAAAAAAEAERLRQAEEEERLAKIQAEKEAAVSNFFWCVAEVLRISRNNFFVVVEIDIFFLMPPLFLSWYPLLIKCSILLFFS